MFRLTEPSAVKHLCLCPFHLAKHLSLPTQRNLYVYSVNNRRCVSIVCTDNKLFAFTFASVWVKGGIRHTFAWCSRGCVCVRVAYTHAMPMPGYAYGKLLINFYDNITWPENWPVGNDAAFSLKKNVNLNDSFYCCTVYFVMRLLVLKCCVYK